MRRRLEEFMQGRYGADEFSRFIMAVTLVLLILNMFTRIPLLYLLALVFLGYVISGCFPEIFQREAVKIMRTFRRRSVSAHGLARSNGASYRAGITIFISARHADRRSGFRVEKERSVSPVRSAEKSLKSAAEKG